MLVTSANMQEIAEFLTKYYHEYAMDDFFVHMFGKIMRDDGYTRWDFAKAGEYIVINFENGMYGEMRVMSAEKFEANYYIY